MAKRVALFILGLTLVLGLFFLYQYFAGPAALPPKAKVAPGTGPTTLPMAYEVRDENGVLLYVITASKSPEAIKDDAGKPLPNQYLMERPLATFYDKSGRTVQVRADECRIVVEQGPKKPAAGIGGAIPGAAGGKVTDAITIREGSLRGHVRMTISPRLPSATGPAPAGGASDLLANGLRIYFDDELHLDGLQEVLSTTGGIHLRADTIGFDGSGMQLVFNRKAQRIEYLGIDKGNQVIIRGVGAKALALAGPATAPATATTSRPKPPTTLAATQPDKVPPTTYKLSFGQDVIASVGSSTLNSERLYVIFTGSRDLADAGKTTTAPAAPAGAPAPAPLANPQPAPALANVPETPEPIAPPKPDDMVIRWTGPMEIRPAGEQDIKLIDGKDIALEAVGTKTKPVTVADARFNVQAGRLWYHGAEERIVLLPEEFGKVILNDPTRGNVECGEVSINQLSKKAVLNGPGLLVAASSTGAPTRVTWMTHMDIDLETSPDAKDPKKSTFAIRHAQLFGASVKSDVLDFTADNLDVLIANVLVKENVLEKDKMVEKMKQVQAMEHLLATGHVVVNSFHKPLAGAPAAPQGGMQMARMEITTTRPAGSSVPVPAELLADGDVVAWRLSDKSKSLAGAAAGSALQRETITAPRLIATLVPKARPAAAPAAGPAATAPAESAFASMGQNFDVTHFIASGGARVEIVPPAGSKTGVIRASAAAIDALPDKGTSTLTAAEGGENVRVAIGDNAIECRQVALDQNTRTFAVPGAGVFTFTLPPDKTRKVATPMLVNWQEAMTYDDVKHLATFTGKPVARMLAADGAADQSDQARLTSEKTLLVQLKPGTPATRAAATQAAVIAPATNPSGLAGSGLALDWIEAVGKVEAYGAQVGPDNKLLTRLRISAIDPSATAPGKLRYSDEQKTFTIDGPGAMVVENFRPEKAGEKVSSSGESIFGWAGGLKYDGTAGTITFSRDVSFFFKPVKPFKFSGGLAGSPGPANPAAAPAGPRDPDIVLLQTDLLVATLAKPNDPADKTKTIDSPIALGAGGNQELSKVEATGGPQMDLGTYKIVNGQMARTITYHIAGDNMSFDVPTNIAYINGKGDEPAVLERPATGARVSARSIMLNMTKDKQYFDFKNPQGNISGFGQ